MEKFAIPSGFECFSLEGFDNHLCLEDLPANKELVLISAPQPFNVETLIGQPFIENGCKLLENNNDNVSNSNGIDNNSSNINNKNKEKWELHSSSTTSDHHLNIFLPSKMHDKHCYAGKFAHTVNVLPNVQIPDFASPQKEGLPPPLPRPQGLWARWKPFGVGGASFNKQKNSKDSSGNNVCGDYTVLPVSPLKRGMKSPRKTHQQVHEEEQQKQQQKQQLQQEEQHLHQEHQGDEEMHQHLNIVYGDNVYSKSFLTDTTLPVVAEDSTLAVANSNSDEGVKKKKRRKKTREDTEKEADTSNDQGNKSSEPQKQKKKKKVVDVDAKENVEQLMQVKTEYEHEEILLLNNAPNNSDTCVNGEVITEKKKRKKNKGTEDILPNLAFYIDTVGNTEISKKKKKEKKFEDNVPEKASDSIEEKEEETEGKTLEPAYYFDKVGATESKKKKKKKNNLEDNVPEQASDTIEEKKKETEYKTLEPVYYLDTVGATESKKKKKKKKNLEDNVPEQASDSIEEKKETEDKTLEPAYYVDTVGATESKKKKKKKNNLEDVPEQASDSIEEKKKETKYKTLEPAYFFDTVGATESKKKKKKNKNETDSLNTVPLPSPLPSICDATISAFPTSKSKKKKKDLQDIYEPVVAKVEPAMALEEEKTVTSNSHPHLGIQNKGGKVKRKRKRKISAEKSGDLPADNGIKVDVKGETMSESANLAEPTDTENTEIISAETKIKKKKKTKKKAVNREEAHPPVKVEADVDVAQPLVKVETDVDVVQPLVKVEDDVDVAQPPVKVEDGVDVVQPPVKIEADVDIPTIAIETPKLKKRKKKKKPGDLAPETVDIKIEEAVDPDKTYEAKSTIDNHNSSGNGEVKVKRKRKKKPNVDEKTPVIIDKSTEETALQDKCTEYSSTEKKAKKRKRKSENPLKCYKYLLNDVKKEETEEEETHNGHTEDSELDSDAEASLLGVAPRKRMCSR